MVDVRHERDNFGDLRLVRLGPSGIDLVAVLLRELARVEEEDSSLAVLDGSPACQAYGCEKARCLVGRFFHKNRFRIRLSICFFGLCHVADRAVVPLEAEDPRNRGRRPSFGLRAPHHGLDDRFRQLLLLVVQGSALIPGGHWFVGAPGKPYPVMTLLDLRGASCAVIRSGGEFALIDTGRKRDAQNTIVPFLESSGANSVRNALITKSDATHLGGLPEIIHEVSVKRIGVPPSPGRSTVAKRFFADFPKAERLKAGEEDALTPGVTAAVLACAPEKDPDFAIVRVNLGDLKVLFLPKLDAGMIESIAKIPEQELKSDLLILPLGGSDMAATLGVIRRVAPRALISRVDALNRNGNPSSEWSRLLPKEGITLLRQDETGAVIIEADPKDGKGGRFVPFLKPD